MALFGRSRDVSLIRGLNSSLTYHSKPSCESLPDLLNALWSLDRLPLLVILNENTAEQSLHELILHFRDILPTESHSVLFRMEEKDHGFNQLIHDRKLNNWLDKETNIVYISNKKLPKLLLKTDWTPRGILSYDSSCDNKVDLFCRFACDLTVFREEQVSPMRRYSRYYAYM